jgi:two-component system, OmpR family, alkaline phosphatase synthesis response regulator PhoP
MKKILLIVDDESIVRKALSSQFDSGEVEVITANDGEAGLEAALEHHPDLILLDLVMPKMDGMTMLTKLREDDWGKKAEVIILTNLSDAERVSEAVDKGTYEYLVKVDWNVTDVVNRVKDKLGLIK